MRSRTLPIAPPRIRASERQNSFSPAWRASSALITTIATSAMPMKKPRCQPAALARKLNAAPLLYVSTRLKNPVTARTSAWRKLALTQYLVSWSSTTTSAARAYQEASLRRRSRFAGAVQVGHAAAAKSGMRGIGAANVITIMPAALAFGVRARGDDHRFIGGRGDWREHRAGGDQHEAQIVLQRLQPRQLASPRTDLDFGLQRGADFPGDTRLLQLFLHFGADAADFPPALEQFRRITRGREFVPGVREHGLVLAAGGHGPDLFRGKREDGGHQPHQALQDLVQRVLRRASCLRVLAGRVQPVLENIEVKPAQILGAETLQLLRHEMEIVIVVVAHHFLLQGLHERERIAVDLQPLFERQRVRLGVEVGGIGEQETQRVADAAVALDHALQDLVGDRQFARIVGCGHP